jgi:AcrR family transcriptional regulator
MPKHPTLAPQQARSRESLKRLLQAAAAVLEEKGLEGATIPHIAQRAGLSPAAVYRRFRDKDALLRTLVLDTLRGTDKRSEEKLTDDLAQQYSLPEFTRTLVATTVQSYRKHAGLMRALSQFTRSHPSAAFRRQADEIEIRNFRRIADFLLRKRAEIDHPDPGRAVPFALMLVALALREMVILDVLSEAWSPLMPKNDDQLVEELTRALLNYLGRSAVLGPHEPDPSRIRKKNL